MTVSVVHALAAQGDASRRAQLARGAVRDPVLPVLGCACHVLPGVMGNKHLYTLRWLCPGSAQRRPLRRSVSCRCAQPRVLHTVGKARPVCGHGHRPPVNTAVVERPCCVLAASACLTFAPQCAHLQHIVLHAILMTTALTRSWSPSLNCTPRLVQAGAGRHLASHLKNSGDAIH